MTSLSLCKVSGSSENQYWPPSKVVWFAELRGELCGLRRFVDDLDQAKAFNQIKRHPLAAEQNSFRWRGNGPDAEMLGAFAGVPRAVKVGAGVAHVIDESVLMGRE